MWLELDFLVRMKGECVPLEVKAKTAQAKSAKTVLKHPEKYQVKQIILEPIDVDAVNALAREILNKQ